MIAPRDVALAVVVAVLWGLAFIATRIGLDELTPPQLAAAVAPFALLVPVVAAGASALVFGERFGALRLAGMALVLCGLAVIVLPGRRRFGDR